MRTSESRRCGRSSPHAHCSSFRIRAEGRSRTHARWRRVPFDREGNSVSFVEFTGKARLDKRTKRLVHRLGRTLSRSSTRRTSIASPPRSCSRAAYAWSSTSHGRRPAACPPSARWARARRPWSTCRARSSSKVRGGELVVRGASLFRNGTRLAAGHIHGRRAREHPRGAARPGHGGARGLRGQHAPLPSRGEQAPVGRRTAAAASHDLPRPPRARRRARPRLQARPQDHPLLHP